MADYKYIVDLNLNGHVITQAKVESRTSPPSGYPAGAFYFNSQVNRFAWCNGSEWIYSLEIESISPSGSQVSLIDDSTGNTFTFRVLQGDDYITIGNNNGIINLTLDYQNLWETFEQLRVQAHFLTYNELIAYEELEIGDFVFCTTGETTSGLYQRKASGAGIDKWLRITDNNGVFIKSGQITEDHLSTEYKQSLDTRFNDLREAIDNQIFTMGFDPSDGSVYIIAGEYNSQIDSAEINQITGEIDVYFNFD